MPGPGKEHLRKPATSVVEPDRRTAASRLPAPGIRAVPAWSVPGEPAEADRPARSGAPAGMANVIRRVIQEKKDGSGKRRLTSSGRVGNQNSKDVLEYLSMKLIIRSRMNVGGENYLNPHEEALVDLHVPQHTKAADVPANILDGRGAMALAICHKLSSEEAQANFLKAFDADKVNEAMGERVKRIAFVDWGEKIPPDFQPLYAKYRTKVTKHHTDALKALAEMVAKAGKPGASWDDVSVAEINDFLALIVDTPKNYFVGDAGLNGAISDHLDANMGGAGGRQRAMTKESLDIAGNSPVGKQLVEHKQATKGLLGHFKKHADPLIKFATSSFYGFGKMNKKGGYGPPQLNPKFAAKKKLAEAKEKAAAEKAAAKKAAAKNTGNI